MRTLLYRLPFLALALGGINPLRIIGLYLKLVWFYARTRGGKSVRTAFRFTYVGTTFTLYPTVLVDIDILEEVFLDKQYLWDIPGEVTTIIDIGAHAGESAIFYHARYPKAQIFAVEPEPTNLERLQRNVASIPNITIVPVAVSDQVGEATLHIVKSTMGASLRGRTTSRQTITVPTMNLPALLTQCGIEKADIIKFDIEGAEDAMLRDLNPADYARAYIGEFHGDLTDEPIEVFTQRFNDYEVTLTTPFSTPDRYVVKAIQPSESSPE